MTQIEHLLNKNHISSYSMIDLKEPISFQHYKTWIENGLYGEMSYLKDHLPLKQSPKNIHAELKSSLVILLHYFKNIPGAEEFPLKSLRVSKYAEGFDYHKWGKEKLHQIIDDLNQLFPQEVYIPFIDTSPILERDLAYQSGLGWFGKNTMIINRHEGSYFFISGILTSLDLSESQLNISPDHCGTCTRCIDLCPTQAIKEDKILDATKCISYWTIESRKIPPDNIKNQIGSWFFGCDICQDVCPWNSKIIKTYPKSPFKVSNDTVNELKWILSSSNKSLEKRLKNTPLSRAGGFGLKRNALIVVGNLKLNEFTDLVRNYLDHAKLGELAKWTLSQFK